MGGCSQPEEHRTLNDQEPTRALEPHKSAIECSSIVNRSRWMPMNAHNVPDYSIEEQTIADC
jgi:hypothetical protein